MEIRFRDVFVRPSKVAARMSAMTGKTYSASDGLAWIIVGIIYTVGRRVRLIFRRRAILT